MSSGTTKINNLEDNIGSLRLKLTEEELKEISDAVPIEEVAGGRDLEILTKTSWKFANTPPKDANVSTWDNAKVHFTGMVKLFDIISRPMEINWVLYFSSQMISVKHFVLNLFLVL